MSLYELALTAVLPPTPLQLSPATLRSLTNGLIDLLVNENLAATLWVKLPKGEVWQADLQRYCARQDIPQTVYLFHQDRDQAITTLQGIGAREAHCYGIVLPNDSLLKREYFLLVRSPQFSAFVIAHRPRSMQSPKPEEPFSLSPETGEDGERKQPLLVVSSLNPQTVQQILDHFQQRLLALSPLPTVITARGDTIPIEVLLGGQSSPTTDFVGTTAVLDHLWATQIKRQEEVWHRAATYRRQAEAAETLHLQNESLLSAIRLKDEFLNNVGQELRTPLTNMKTALTLLSSSHLKPAQRQRYTELLQQECDRQSSLITSLLDLVQLHQVSDLTTLQPLNLIDIVPGVVSTYQPLAQEKGIMLAYTIPPNLPTVACLSPWLKQIVINLLHNCIKFTEKEGQVWVQAKQQGDYIQLEFRDSGIGIPGAEIPKIFDRFYRVRQPNGEERAGSGLGLTIVQQILWRCGGSVSVKSKLGEGSTFNVLLPIYHPVGLE
ncbi:ATP-binding protein [Neosynechococcus sphagnicola]|nr:ATP-binding protein [Neosynechococcus sphagnicola]